MTFVPEASTRLRRHAPDTVLVAAGGIADGRGLAAALALGADGVLIGTRFWASREALVHSRHHDAIVTTDGDGTVRTTSVDIVRRRDWPQPFTIRVRENAFVRRWQEREAELQAGLDVEAPRYARALVEGDPDEVGVIFGEAAGLIGSIEPAAAIVERIAADAETILRRGADSLA